MNQKNEQKHLFELIFERLVLNVQHNQTFTQFFFNTNDCNIRIIRSW